MQTYFIFRLRDNEVIQAKSLELHILFCFVLFCFVFLQALLLLLVLGWVFVPIYIKADVSIL